MEGVLVRSRARWIGEREKVSNYFCSLEKRHYRSKIIRKIEKRGGTIVTEKNDSKRNNFFYENRHDQEDQISNVKLKKLSRNVKAFLN